MTTSNSTLPTIDCPCQATEDFFCESLKRPMTPHLAYLCRTDQKYHAKWLAQRDNQPASRQKPPTPVWLTCKHRVKVLASVTGAITGVGCRTSGQAVYLCDQFQEPVVKRATARNLPKITEVVPEFQGRVCQSCKAPFCALPIGKLTQNTAQGIITGANEIHWACLGALAIVAYEQGLGLAVADHGLTPIQRAELDRIGVHWIQHERPVLTPSGREHIIVAHPHAWWKPWVCLASPFIRTVWIDSDAVVTSDISLLFSTDKLLISDQTLLAGESDRIYGRLLKLVHGQSPDTSLVYQQCKSLNSGIMAWTEGESLLEEWRDITAKYLQDSKILEACNVRDQSSLLSVLMHRVEQGQTIEFLHPTWNYPADGLPSKQLKQRKRVSRNPVKFLADARQRHPGARIVHWLGHPKPWDLYED